MVTCANSESKEIARPVPKQWCNGAGDLADGNGEDLIRKILLLVKLLKLRRSDWVEVFVCVIDMTRAPAEEGAKLGHQLDWMKIRGDERLKRMLLRLGSAEGEPSRINTKSICKLLHRIDPWNRAP